MSDKIIISVSAEHEHIGELASLAYTSDFIQSVREMRRRAPLWGWCCVKVEASIPGIDLVGEAFLGHCSYYSKSDFVEKSGYYEQLVADAKSDLYRKIKDRLNDFQKFVSVCSTVDSPEVLSSVNNCFEFVISLCNEAED